MKIRNILLQTKGLFNIRRSLFLLNVLMLCLAVWLAGMLAARIAENQFLTVPAEKPKFIPQRESNFEKPRKFSDFKAIIDYNVFDAEVSSTSLAEIEEPIKPTSDNELSRILSTLKLLGMGSSGGQSFCIIRNTRLKTEDVFRKGEELVFSSKKTLTKSGLIVFRIVNTSKDQRVFLKYGTKIGVLEFQEETSEKANSSSPALSPRLRGKKSPAKVVSESNYSTDGQNYYIDSTEVDSHLNNFANLLNQARMVPHFVKGKHQGYKVKAIDKGSLYEKLGLRNNDVITELNGEPLDSPERVMGLFKQLRNEREFSVKLNRKGTPLVFNIYVN
jgi:type II secretion system protein C